MKSTPSQRGRNGRRSKKEKSLISFEIFFCSYHPYLFFNRDGFSMTFVGFNANKDGDLIDPVKNARIEGLERVVSAQLQAGLRHNQVNLSENYQLWNKMTMMQKMSLVLGLEYVTDPDSSYVLTVDNVIKILAIQMRFR